METVRILINHDIDAYIAMLEKANDDRERVLYGNLLRDAAGRLSGDDQRDETTTRCLAACRERIQRQAHLMHSLGALGADMACAKRFMDNLRQIEKTLLESINRQRAA